MDLAIDRKIVVKEVALREGAQTEPVIYASQYYQLELHVAQMLKELALEDTVDEERMEAQLVRLEKSGNVELDEKQRQAVIEL